MTGCTPEHEVEVQADPEEAGKITGEGAYEEGEEVTVEAEPEEGYEFIKWKEDGEEITSDKDYKLEVSDDITLEAQFEKIEHEVSLELNDEEKGEVSGSGTYEEGEEVKIEAVPDNEDNYVFEYVFKNWTKNGEEISTDKSYQFQVTEDKRVVANFERYIADDNLKTSLKNELVQLSRHEIGQKAEGGVLDLKHVMQEELSPSYLTCVTNLVVDEKMIQLKNLLRWEVQPDEIEKDLSSQLSESNIRLHYNGKDLFNIIEVFNAIEENWDEIICPMFAEHHDEYDLKKHTDRIEYVRDLSLSPSENKLAIGLDNSGCAFKIGATGIIDLKDKSLGFTNISGGFPSNKKWSPDNKHVAYVSDTLGKGDSYLYIDNVEDKSNQFTLTAEKLNSVLKEEGMKRLEPIGPGDNFKLGFSEYSWSEKGETFYFVTNMKNVKWEEGNESDIKAIEWTLDIKTDEIKITNIKK